MNLRAWFDPRIAGDPRQWLIDRKVLGSWRLHRFEKVQQKKLYVHREELHLADGSALGVSAMCDWTFVDPQVTLTVARGEEPLCVVTGTGTAGLAATIATGKGGFLALEVSFDQTPEPTAPSGRGSS